MGPLRMPLSFLELRWSTSQPLPFQFLPVPFEWYLSNHLNFDGSRAIPSFVFADPPVSMFRAKRQRLLSLFRLNPFVFKRLQHSVSQRRINNAMGINSLRIRFPSTDGVPRRHPLPAGRLSGVN